MKVLKPVSTLMLLTLAAHIAVPAALASGNSLSAPPGAPCAPSMAMTDKETETYYQFNARLSWLVDHYGKPSFEGKLKAIVENGWPRKKLADISPAYYDRLYNLVEQARLKDAIARTVGLDHPAWVSYEGLMRTITLHQSMGNDLLNPFEKTAIKLLKSIGSSAVPGKKGMEADLLRAETLARVSNMHGYLQKWRVINGEIQDEKAEASAKLVAMTAIGLVGAGVLVSTLVIAGPVVSGAGALAASVPASPLISTLLVKTAETAAGAAIGFYGAPGARALEDSYHAISEGKKQAANNGTKLSCELGKTADQWRQVAGDNLLSAALTGAAMGLAGGALTFTSKGAKVVLWGTGLGVGLAQAYALGKMTQKSFEAIAAYKLAEQLEAKGQRDEAVAMLKKARDIAQEEGHHALSSIIIGALAYHVGAHFEHALHEGAGAIRQLYAASADTIPTAEKAAENMVVGAADLVLKRDRAEAALAKH